MLVSLHGLCSVVASLRYDGPLVLAFPEGHRRRRLLRRFGLVKASPDALRPVWARCAGGTGLTSCPVGLHPGQPVDALAASFWRRGRRASPAASRPVRLSMRPGPVFVFRNVSRLGEELSRGWPRPASALALRVVTRTAVTVLTRSSAGALRLVPRLRLIMTVGSALWRAGYGSRHFGRAMPVSRTFQVQLR